MQCALGYRVMARRRSSVSRTRKSVSMRGLPSLESALYKAWRPNPLSAAMAIMPLARATLPKALTKYCGVFLFQSRVQIGDHCFVAIEDLSDVPRHVFFFARGATYSSRVVSASSYRRGRLDLDFDHLEGGRQGGWLVVVGGGFRAAIGDNLAVIGDGLF